MQTDEQRRSATERATAMCETTTGYQFSPEKLADFEKVATGEITEDQVIQKHLQKLAKLKTEHPEQFAKPGESDV